MSNQMLPERIGRLSELAYNLWWSWHYEARDVFRALDYGLWRLSGHNPVKQLRDIGADKLKEAASDPSFLVLYDSVMSAFDGDMSGSSTWFKTRHPGRLHGPIAFLSAEFAIHNSLPIYAGGLGVLSGDICKEASDLGLPLVAVGFMYPQGYFHQHISPEGWQEENYRQLDFNEAPVTPVFSPEGGRALAQVQMENRTVSIGAWLVRVGRVDLYLLDTSMEENAPEDRQLSNRLYTADREQRIQQEIVLGIGGVRVLRALGIQPSVWHGNEGHTAFMMVERLREELARGIPLPESMRTVQASTTFTTHTPIPAGHDVFPVQLMEEHFQHYWDSLGIDRDKFLELGQPDRLGNQGFNMTALALKTAGRCQAVSRLNGAVARRMWHVMWPTVKVDEVPISHITNGVHLPTWVAPELATLYDKYLGREWFNRQDDPLVWRRVLDIPDDELWTVRRRLKGKLMGAVLERAQKAWGTANATAEQVTAMGALLATGALTIGFARRFVEYKRPGLLFYDVNRLKQIVKDERRPVQILFSGKSHPNDFLAKYLVHQACTPAMDRVFEGRIAFVEDYDMHMAHYLVQGVDVWLNTPRRLQEACGTSGMKASSNGVLHLSVRDGWWHEGYNGANGWVIGDERVVSDPAEEDKADAEALYQLLEKEIVPLYYERDSRGVPHGWIRMMKESICSIVPVFCARRMMKEYTERVYLPSAEPVRK